MPETVDMNTARVQTEEHRWSVWLHSAHPGQTCEQHHQLMQDVMLRDFAKGRETLVRPDVLPADLWRHVEEQLALIADKSLGYGQAWRTQGYMGNIGRLLSKMERLRNLAWHEVPDGDDIRDEEAIREELADIANIALFGLTNLDNDNVWGGQ